MGAQKKNGIAAGNKRSYEECRRKRVEEKKKRMLQLNLGALVKALSASPKPSPIKVPRKQMDPSTGPIRRSSRITSLPAPNYKEIHNIDPSERLLRGSYLRRDRLNSVCIGCSANLCD